MRRKKVITKRARMLYRRKKEMFIMHTTLVIMWVFLALSVGGCTTIVGTVAGVVSKPILGLAVKDAKTTLLWIDHELKAERMLPIVAEAAKQYPLSVIALNNLRDRMAAGATAEEGFKGWIYYSTLTRYGRGVQAEASKYLERLAKACLPLIPAKKLIKVF